MHGKQPQVVSDAKGVAHIVFLSGKERATDVFYVKRSGGKFSKPMKVNQIAGSAMAMGTICGPHIALGKYGRVHVALEWFASGRRHAASRVADVLHADAHRRQRV